MKALYKITNRDTITAEADGIRNAHLMAEAIKAVDDGMADKEILALTENELRHRYDAGEFKFTCDAITMSDTDLLQAEVHKLVSEVNALYDTAEELTPAQLVEITKAKARINSHLTYYTDSVKLDKFEEYASMSQPEAWNAFLKSQTVRVYSVREDKETLRLVEKSADDEKAKQVELSAYNLIESILSAHEVDTIKDALVILQDNLSKFHTANGQGTDKKSLSKEYLAIRSRMGWEKYDTKTALAEQATALAQWMMGKDKAPAKLINPDVTYLLSRLIDGKDAANKAGGFVTKEPATVCNALFRACYTRLNKLAYGFQTQNPDKPSAPVKTERNKAMAEPPEKTPAEPVVTKSTIESTKK